MKVAETATVAPLSLASAAAETVRWLLNGRHALALAVEDGRVRRTALTHLLLHAEPIGDQTFRLADGVAAPFFDPADRDSPAVLFLLPDRDGLPVAVLLVVTDAVPDAERLMVAASVARQAAFGLECVGLADRSARLLAKERLLAELGREVGATLVLSVIVAALEARVMTVFGAGVVLTADAQGRFAPPQHRQLAALGADRCAELTAIAAVADTATIWHTDALDQAERWQTALGVYVVPLRSGGRLYGSLLVPDSVAQPFSQEDTDLLEALAAQVAGPMAGSLLYAETQRLAEQLQHHADRLSVLNRIAGFVTSPQDNRTILAAVTAAIQQGFGYPQVDLMAVDDANQELELVAAAGDFVAAPLGTRQHINIGLLGRAARNGEVLNVAEVSVEPDYLQLLERASIRSELVVPICSGDQTLGVLNVESPLPHAFGSEDITVLRTVADMLAGLLANARLSDRAQTAAVLEERQRLARELHDSVSQQLFSMTLTAQAARAHAERSPARLPPLLERLQETATAALAEMRALIHQLMPPALSDQGLVAALQHHAQSLAQREHLHIALQIVGDDRAARGLELPIFRIVQEALNNIIKHADAQHVQLQLAFQPEQIVVGVVDDGCGFDPTVPPSGTSRQFGLLSMRERAQELGGTFAITSEAGRGTAVTVTLPRQLRRTV